MSNRIARNEVRLIARLRKLFGHDFGINCTGRKAQVCNMKKPEQAIDVQVVGSKYHLRCEAFGFVWQGPKLAEGANQLKLILMIAG